MCFLIFPRNTIISALVHILENLRIINYTRLPIYNTFFNRYRATSSETL